MITISLLYVSDFDHTMQNKFVILVFNTSLSVFFCESVRPKPRALNFVHVFPHHTAGAQFIKDHAEFGELFPEWKLWESARYCHRFFSKLHLMSEFNDMMSKNVDFLHPRLHNGVVLQCIQHVTNSVTTSLYDGVSEQDHNFLILLLSKMCVS